MWISRKEWQEVQDRLKAVENRLRELSYVVHDATEVTEGQPTRADLQTKKPA